MTSQQKADEMLALWQERRAQGIAPEQRLEAHIRHRLGIVDARIRILESRNNPGASADLIIGKEERVL